MNKNSFYFKDVLLYILGAVYRTYGLLHTKHVLELG